MFRILQLIAFVPLCTGSLVAGAQRIDHQYVSRNIQRSHYFRFHYDNDYFTATDKYYTQGITLEYVHPTLKHFLPAKLLWKPFRTIPQYGVTFNIFGYTPTSITSDIILYDDRPFDANLSLKTFLVQTDPVHEQQVSVAFSAGVMGPAALGKEIQTGIHRWTKDPLPHGWEYQIRNDIILNYQVNYEKKLLSAGTHFLFNAFAEARLGTLDDKISGGLNLMVGQFNNRFQPPVNGKRKTEYYLFTRGSSQLTAYDASLQGGLFNRSSPYTISNKDITRINFRADGGILVNFRKLYFSYTQSFLTKEFRTGREHRWGGLSIGFAL